MSKKSLIRYLIGLTIGGSLAPPPARAADVEIRETVVASAPSEAARTAILAAAHAFYAFWNSGDERLLARAIAPTFTDRTLPPGRPQGPEGPAFASRQFRGAVPDLGVTVEKMIVAGPYVTVHMRFRGHFTGHLGKATGKGQAVDFIATDLLKFQNGLITDNWHLEDNLTLLQQMDVVPRS